MIQFALSAFVCAALVSMSLAQDVKLTATQIPPVVSTSALQKFPQAKLSNWSKETEDGKTTFEVSVVDGKGKRDAVFSPQGLLLSTESSLQVNALPDPVKSAIHAKYPGARIHKAEKITLASNELQYEVDLLNSAKKEVLLSAGGKILKEE